VASERKEITKRKKAEKRSASNRRGPTGRLPAISSTQDFPVKRI